MIHKEKLLGSRQKTLNEHVHKIRQFESDKKIKNERLRFLQDKSHQLREQIEQDKKAMKEPDLASNHWNKSIEFRKSLLKRKNKL